MIGGRTVDEARAAEYTKMFSWKSRPPAKVVQSAPNKPAPPRKLSLTEMAAADLARRGQNGGGHRWIEHVKNYRAAHPGMSYKEAMQGGKRSYKK